MEPRAYNSGTSESPPPVPASPSIGYPTSGDPSSAQPATVPGPYRDYAIGEEIRNVILEAGLTPNITDLTQLQQAIALISQGTKSVSSDYPVTQGGLISFTHGLGAAPGIVNVFIRCLSAEYGYSVGDVVSLNFANFTATSFTHNTGGTVKINDTDIQIRLGDSDNTSSAIFAHDWTTGERASLTNANWAVFVEARL
jgi:hypothetical protein